MHRPRLRLPRTVPGAVDSTCVRPVGVGVGVGAATAAPAARARNAAPVVVVLLVGKACADCTHRLYAGFAVRWRVPPNG